MVKHVRSSWWKEGSRSSRWGDVNSKTELKTMLKTVNNLNLTTNRNPEYKRNFVQLTKIQIVISIKALKLNSVGFGPAPFLFQFCNRCTHDLKVLYKWIFSLYMKITKLPLAVTVNVHSISFKLVTIKANVSKLSKQDRGAECISLFNIVFVQSFAESSPRNKPICPAVWKRARSVWSEKKICRMAFSMV